ncbi:MAG: DegV family protein [Chloroflexi bacterium]|nr:DegV family protein [Chloroflexota bacterium]
MMIKIVTDSACDVPEAIAVELGITIVPVYINIGEESYLEGVELPRQTFYRQLSGYEQYPTTAAPASGTFTETYERLAREGATEILSLHVASGLSATLNAARLGAKAQTAVPVTLFDTQQITLGSGLLIIMAAEMAAAGRSLAEIVTALNQRVQRAYVFGMLETLEALRRSGRVGLAQFSLGTLLQIKPVMMIHQGVISVAAKIRTRKRAVQYALQAVAGLSPYERLAVIHVNAPEAAEQLRQRAAHLFPQGHPPLTMEITPAIGIHLGLGAVGFACITKKE